MASLESVADRESVSVALNPESCKEESSNANKREVTPNEDETVEEFVFRILGQKILKMLIMNTFSSKCCSRTKKEVLSYRAVCRGWRDNIHLICFNIGVSLFHFHFPFIEFENDIVVTGRLSEKFEKFSSLLASTPDSSVLPPVGLYFNLACPPDFLDKKLEVETTLFNSLRKIEGMILSLWFHLSHDFQPGNDWCSLNMENLKHLSFSWCGPYIPGFPSEMTDSVTCPTVPALTLPKSLKVLDIIEVKLPMWLIDVAPTLLDLKQLTLTPVSKQRTGEEAADHLETLLIANLANSLECLKFAEPCHTVEIYNPEPLELPVAFSIVKPMPKLNSLEVNLKNWRIGELKGYKEFLPSLANLTVVGLRANINFPTSWYASPCLTLSRLSICSDTNWSNFQPLGEQVLVAISKNFPKLKELIIVAYGIEGPNWQANLCQGLPNLSRLVLTCPRVPAEGRNRLVAAMSGIPFEELQAIYKNEKVLEDAISNYKHYPSLRDMSNLQELTLHVYHYNEAFDAVKTDSNVMINSTFLQMPTLKLVKLSPSFQLTDEIIKQTREKTGLIIRYGL